MMNDKNDESGRKPLQEFSRNLFLQALQKPRLVSCPQGIVAYALADAPDVSDILTRTFDPEAIDQKIREILEVNPDAEFTPELQAVLGITILSVQKNPHNKPSASISPEEDVLF